MQTLNIILIPDFLVTNLSFHFWQVDSPNAAVLAAGEVVPLYLWGKCLWEGECVIFGPLAILQ